MPKQLQYIKINADVNVDAGACMGICQEFLHDDNIVLPGKHSMYGNYFFICISGLFH